MTHPFEITDCLPWETNIQKCTLQRCEHLYSKLKKDLSSLKLYAESQKKLRNSYALFKHTCICLQKYWANH